MNKLTGDFEDAYGFGSTTISMRKMILSRTNKEGLTKVLIEVRQHKYDGTGKYKDSFKRISTDVWILPKNWKKEQAVGTDAYQNKKINEVLAAVQKYVDSKGVQYPDQAYAEKLNLDSLREFFPSRSENKRDLYDYIEDYITFRKGQKTPHGTLKEFKSMQNRVQAFDTNRHKQTRFEDISLHWSDDFEYYLKNVALDNKGYNIGTVHKTYTILCTVLNHFYNRRKVLDINLSDDFRIHGSIGASNGFKRGKQSVNLANPLYEAQLEIFKNFEFEEEHFQVTKDRFLWQCYTGVRYVDAFTITKDQIQKGWLRFKPTKTERYDTEVNQPLNEVAIALLKKYNYDMTSLAIRNQPYNRQIKNMFEVINNKMRKDKIEIEFRTDYGTHSGRDTFVTMCINKGIDWKTILGWVGQSSYKIMARYYGLNDKYQEEKMKKISSN
jgi:integrase